MRTAVIGAGRMGQRHIQVVRSLGLPLVGVCDRRVEALAAAEQEFGLSPEQQFSDAQRLFERKCPECVIVATTAPSHCAYTCDAARTGARYVLCEKPMARSLAECDAMIETCASHGARLAINHSMRFMRQYTEAKRIVQSPEFGGLTSVVISAGNMGMAMNGSHYFEMFRYMTDEPAAEVTAWFSKENVPNPRGPEFEDRAVCVRVTTPSGKRMYLEMGADQGYGIKVVYAGPYGQLCVDELAGAMHWTVREARSRDLPSTRYALPGIELSQKIEPVEAVAPTRMVLDALLNDRDVPTGKHGRMAVEVLVAAHVSNESEHIPVRVDGQLPRDRAFRWA